MKIYTVKIWAITSIFGWTFNVLPNDDSHKKGGLNKEVKLEDVEHCCQ